MNYQQREKQLILRREKHIVMLTNAIVIGLIILVSILLPIPAFQTMKTSPFFPYLFVFSMLGWLVLSGITTGIYSSKVLQRKHAWLSCNGIEVKARITRIQIRQNTTPSGDDDPIPCIKLSWDHPATRTHVFVWKTLPSDLYQELPSDFPVLCDPTDPFFFLTLHPTKPSQYPLPSAPGYARGPEGIQRNDYYHLQGGKIS